ncbi:interferon-inducible double-stranded RNA-dependent protein kinase activator A homolog isoform X2 [Rhopalosiphum maidis]|uniref:interferon-inducible double-stranded RNA-dependent protein kinase activator A homolog isoform X1 n=2 Tax=Rhopalosiphum maidis TaxID=43146 RepID=UPI000F00CC78|nr:interferon-inducible double-stranded RNA-dependent protein kinase activator A homolog isoform X1 [Rhopalosiphum maidis]XP_026823260.1 interferon-inducible double-stranded RNA-dependent protein kinase activator A homolog isoform X2 [Rhopalosiphum maidis]
MKMNESIVLDLQDKSAHISSLNKTPASIVQEYAAKNRLVPQYDLIHNGISHSKISFKYSLTMDNYVAVGEGSSKKEAKHVAALNLLKLMIDDKPQLLNTDFKQWDFDNHVVSPFDNNIKVNAVGQLNDICSNNKLGLPEFNLVREEGQAHAKLFTMSCHVAKMVETATHKTKKQAKHLAAVQMVNKLMSIDKSLVMEGASQVSDSKRVLEQVEIIKSELSKKSMPMDEHITNYHMLFKTFEWTESDTLIKIINQYHKNNDLELLEPFNILYKVVTESGMCLTSIPIDEEFVDLTHNSYCILAIENVYPNVYGAGEADTIEKAKCIAAKQLLIAICILLD